MKLKTKVISLADNQIEKLKSVAPMRYFQVMSDLFYEGQVPCVAYLLIEGQINLMKKRKVCSKLKKGSLFGVSELMKNAPSGVGAQICPNTKVCFLDRSTITEILEDSHDNELTELFQSLVYGHSKKKG